MTNQHRRQQRQVSVDHTSIRVEELHFHLGDLLPDYALNYSEDGDVTLKIIMHYSDPHGRDCRKTMTLRTTIL